jgi:hypothetical protein
MRRKLRDVQLAHVPDIMPREVPENIEPLIFRDFEFLSMYTFMLTTRPISTDVTFERMKFGIASAGR